jgi:hypothetical protein
MRRPTMPVADARATAVKPRGDFPAVIDLSLDLNHESRNESSFIV